MVISTCTVAMFHDKRFLVSFFLYRSGSISITFFCLNSESLPCTLSYWPWKHQSGPIQVISRDHANNVRDQQKFPLIIYSVLRIRIRDPVTFWSLDPGSGMGKKSGSGSGMTNPDHISESLDTIFWVKILKFVLCGSGMEKIRNRDPG